VNFVSERSLVLLDEQLKVLNRNGRMAIHGHSCTRGLA